MTTVTCIKTDPPGDLSIMADRAESSIPHRLHTDRIGAAFQLKDRRVADVTAVPDPMNPVRENSDRGVGDLGLALKDDVTVHSQPLGYDD